MKKLTLTISLFCVGMLLFAAAPATYYDTAEGKSDNTLRLSLQGIIDGHTVVSYDNLNMLYIATDSHDDGSIWDMYSTCSWQHNVKKCGNYQTVCDCYNKEHSIPQSWFGSSSPMVSDAFHVYPTDGKVNGQRSNYPFGECSNGTVLTSKALGRLGTSTFSGGSVSGSVFEPDDEYKGDFARTYFYMATRYADKCSSWGGQSFGSVNGLTTYSVALFLKWHRQDPVSDKERVRNDAIFGLNNTTGYKQNNRNPFIDYPELAEYIWGTQKGQAWYKTSTAIEQTVVPQLLISPNPAKDVVVITAQKNTELTYRIVNLSGQTLSSGSTQSGSAISVSHLVDGMYLLEIYTEGKSQTLKFVINQ